MIHSIPPTAQDVEDLLQFALRHAYLPSRGRRGRELVETLVIEGEESSAKIAEVRPSASAHA
jgi:hypothetical protein